MKLQDQLEGYLETKASQGPGAPSGPRPPKPEPRPIWNGCEGGCCRHGEGVGYTCEGCSITVCTKTK